MSSNGDSNFCSLNVKKEGKVGLPFATNDVGENHEADEVNFDRPLRLVSMKNKKMMMMTKVLARHSSSREACKSSDQSKWRFPKDSNDT